MAKVTKRSAKKVAAKKRGRPSTGKRGTFTFRVTDRLRQRLSEVAIGAGRPVSEEIESRLEQSFAEERVLYLVTDMEDALSAKIQELQSEMQMRLRGVENNLGIAMAEKVDEACFTKQRQEQFYQQMDARLHRYHQAMEQLFAEGFVKNIHLVREAKMDECFNVPPGLQALNMRPEHYGG